MITLTLSSAEIQMLINAVEILSPDDPKDQDLNHELYCKLLSVAEVRKESLVIDPAPEPHLDDV